MGAWGVGALQNDRALDAFDWMDSMVLCPAPITMITSLLLNSRYEEEVVLGAVMVLSAYENKYANKEFFISLYGNGGLKELLGDAINRIYELIEQGAPNWRTGFKAERIAYLKELKGELEKWKV